MRNSQKGELSHSTRDVFGVNFHDFMVKEQSDTSMELASEFGISLREVKNLKKHLNRS
ncbi:RNA polymerase subunit sigma-70 [Bacillus weihaiensis]|uniref:RNA polymerase subunit sigma-70 n=1 Tax=Bacillus weihaiensis TaxID=1547283 RepID=A0A1L3MPJ1_9BACI|nr:RNA polymerase subunit sigma-70 [Bacillus weihaiensis]APH04268.1 RNA polymerase subunit sigma-70 [Bacillus weihaiensis]